ncbi:MAG: hypothetical protein M1152_02500 [Actinobacteria bacterium]|nr:hypothetical protein [Actinomycetota bacterium]
MERRWVILAILFLVGMGMFYSLEWNWMLGDIFHPFRCSPHLYCVIQNHKKYNLSSTAGHVPFAWWSTPGDIWGTINATRYLIQGHFGSIYANKIFLVALPGILLLLIPVVLVVQALGLGFDFSNTVPHPSSWLLIGPYEMIIGSLSLFALDALAKRLEIPPTRRAVLTFLEAAALWPMLVLWGHPEDAIALGIGLYGLMAAYDKRHVKAGWLFGIAISIQPLVGLIFPIVFGLTKKRHWLSLAIQGGLPSAVLLAAPIIQSPRSTLGFVFQQPSYPLVDHPTPWVYFAPVMKYRINGHLVTHITTPFPAVVSAGPVRILAVVAAFAAGYWIFRKLPPLMWVIWVAGLSLAFRCFFESVMAPYYFWPAIALGILVAAKGSLDRFILTVTLGGALTVFSFWHLNPWLYWLSMMLLLAGILGCSVFKGGVLEGTLKNPRRRGSRNQRRSHNRQRLTSQPQRHNSKKKPEQKRKSHLSNLPR